MKSKKNKLIVFGFFTLLFLFIAGCGNNVADQNSINQTPVIEDANGEDNRTPDEYVEETIQNEFVDDDIEIGELI